MILHSASCRTARRGGIRWDSLAAACTAGLWAAVALAVPIELERDLRAPDRPVRAALFQAPGFPTADAPEIGDEVLTAALAHLPVDRLTSVQALNDELRLQTYDALVLPYGSAFPLDAWVTIRAFVQRGGSLVVLGGAPLHQPVRLVDGDYVLGVRQPTFAHELLIGPAEAWTRDRADEAYGPLATKPVETSAWRSGHPDPSTVYELIVRLATVKDLPAEHGSEGHRDAVLRPLVHVEDRDGLPRACPLLEIDRLRGDDAGGRWLLAPSDAPLPAELIRDIAARALQGAAQLDARPVYASVEAGEVPMVRVVQRRPFVRDGEEVPDTAQLVVTDPDGVEVFRSEVALTGQPESRHGVAQIRTGQPLAPGLYRVDVTTPDATWLPRSASTGFWVRDEVLLGAGPKITVSRDWLRKDGDVMPVNGTTYMASDVQRKFLFEPDPLTWDRDFEQMASLGINFVRTGLWTAWDRAMLNSGAVDEAFLRALDAYVQAAARHGIVVNYTFFAFRPQGFGADNPYLDPRAFEGQRELLTLVARRFRDVGWVHWDLINEPSYAPAHALWTNQPIGDRHEERAWKEWVMARHGDTLREETVALLRDRWQDPTKWVLTLPDAHEAQYQAIRGDLRPRKARDFQVFSQGVVTEWARTLRQILRDAGGDVLVTLGQDEGGTFTRPSQQIHAEAVDYTGIHPWWRNDDILADGVMAKVPEKPNLFQETGIMRLEDVDGWPWRTPEIAAQTLERKYAYAFASRGAGVIEWAWNINPYQPIDNESVIGFIRPDGTLKPEIRVVPDLARFFDQAAPWLDDFEPAEVIAVIPHSRLLMGRPGGAEGFKRILRVLAERLGVVPTGLSELRLTAQRLEDAKLVIVPSPLMLEDSAAEALLAASQTGTKVLVTGVVTGNPYGETTPALAELGIADAGRPVRYRESTGWAASPGPAGGWATFSGDKREQFLRSEAEPLGPELTGSVGNEGVWHEPLPLEFADEDEPIHALLAAALEAAGVTTQPSEVPVAARLLHAPRSVFAVVVNESGADAVRRLTVEGKTVDVPVLAGRSRLALFEKGSGALLAATSGPPITFPEPECANVELPPVQKPADPQCANESLTSYDGLLVLAPHPDDEVLGFSGLVSAYLDQGKPVKVVVVTDGDAYCQACSFWKTSSAAGATCSADELSNFATPEVDSFAEVRHSESRTAASLVGYEGPELLRYPDTGLDAAWSHSESGDMHSLLRRSDFSHCNSCGTCTGGYGEGPETDLSAATLVAALYSRLEASSESTLVATTHPLDGHGDHAALGRFVRLLNRDLTQPRQVVYGVIHAHTPKDTRHPDCWHPGPAAPHCACMEEACAEKDPARIATLSGYRLRPDWPATEPDDADYGTARHLCLPERLHHGDDATKLAAVRAYGSQLGTRARSGEHPPALSGMMDCSGYLTSFVRRTELFFVSVPRGDSGGPGSAK